MAPASTSQGRGRPGPLRARIRHALSLDPVSDYRTPASAFRQDFEGQTAGGG
jgi:hypothetical protein